MKRAMTASGAAIAARVPEPVRRRLAPGTRYLSMMFVDHVWVRLFFTNRRRLADGVWRSAQPLPHQLRRYAREGIRTIINLRGRNKTATYGLEKETCAAAGLTLVDFEMKSRAAPAREVVLAVRELVATIEHPVLLHCKSGADRAGLMSALYLHFRKGAPIADAKRQLSLYYGHIRQADTGILDAFFERYLSDNAERPIEFVTWVETVYDPDELQRTYKANSWASRLVRTMKRE